MKNILVFIVIFSNWAFAQSDFLENNYDVYQGEHYLNCLPDTMNNLNRIVVTDTCGGYFVRGVYRNGQKNGQFVVDSEILYVLHYKEGVLDGEQRIQDSNNTVICHYSEGVEQGWYLQESSYVGQPFNSFEFAIVWGDATFCKVSYTNDGVPLSLEEHSGEYVFKVQFYRSGKPATFTIHKERDVVYAASYRESGVIQYENVGLIKPFAGNVDDAFLISATEMAQFFWLISGVHREYDENGVLILEESKEKR